MLGHVLESIKDSLGSRLLLIRHQSLLGLVSILDQDVQGILELLVPHRLVCPTLLLSLVPFLMSGVSRLPFVHHGILKCVSL